MEIRFHVGWDCGNCTAEEGWYIDDVVVTADSIGSCAITHDVYLSMANPPKTRICDDIPVRSCPVGPLPDNEEPEESLVTGPLEPGT